MLLELIKSDLARIAGSDRQSVRSFLRGLLSQGFQAIFVYRIFHGLTRRGSSGHPLRFICERFIEVTTGISIPAECRIGRGFRIHHFGAIIFHPTVEIGDNCTVYHGVTIGDRGGVGRAARIGNNVLIGAGAMLIGEITIGDGCVIGANAVVAKSMPPGTTALGASCRFRFADGRTEG